MRISSPVGPLYLVASEKGLCGIFKKTPRLASASQKSSQQAILKQAQRELMEYFSGQRRDFSVRLDLDGTPFQKRVWRQLAKIPYGTTCSYKEISQSIGQPKAARAVGAANGRNPVCIIIPCHRVISHSGGLGGYSGGLSMKRKLIAIESSSLRLSCNLN